MRPKAWAGWLALLVVTRSGVAQEVGGEAADQLQVQRDEFARAYELALLGDGSAASDSEALRSYPLYPYLRSRRIASALERSTDVWTAADEDAREFVSSYATEPVGSSLRRTWLTSLGRREAWMPFLEHYREGGADARLRCQYLAARIATEALSGIAPAIIDEWLTPRQLPIECEPVFAWLRDEGLLTDELVERRVRLLLENGQAQFARIIAERLPEDRAAPLLRWADFVQTPGNAIDAYLVMLTGDVEGEVLLDGWTRLTRNDPAAGLERFDELRAVAGLDEDQTSRFALALALGLAWDRRPQALEMFARVRASELDDYALGWRARAAMWAGDWQLVDESIGAMSDHQRAAAAWRYWAARAAEVRRDRARARRLYESLSGDDNYYSASAAARLRRRVEPQHAPLPVDGPTLTSLAARAALVRARELYRNGLSVEAMREWRYGLADLDDRSRLQSIHVAAEWQWYDLAVATATRHGVFYDYPLLYPKPFGREVLVAATSTAIAPELIYGIMRQESLYRVDARSAAGARGLMQLLPGTAERTARHLGDRAPDHNDLFDPAVNIHLGAAELERLLTRYDGQVPVALAAYNAGPNAAERWLPDQPLDADVWIENIPYNETRAYVRRVLWHTVVFRWLDTGRAQSTRGWSQPIVRPPEGYTEAHQ